MKEKYIPAEMELVEFENEDVITGSLPIVWEDLDGDDIPDIYDEKY